MDIQLQQVSYAYSKGTPFEKYALHDVDLSVKSGTYQAIIGHTGSGKSTILQHFNGLLKPTSGTVKIGDRMIVANKKAKELKPIRQKVGIVFQFPEHQLFEETVLKDIMFGPMNFGVSEELAEKRARELITLVGLPDSVLEKSPFDLSGGQMRRVAIAGVLAMEPEVIVLDEPTAGLDPRGQKEIMDLFYDLHQKRGLTTILVTHSMEDAARYADKIAIMHEGRCVLTGEPRELFTDIETLSNYRLEPPRIVRFQQKIEKMMNKKLSKICLTEEELAIELGQAIREGREDQ
ncbi:energy-coupling factor ABC transporter ATP-binding protein [Lysinibacillus sp. 2017]|uniref:energy-coupling factor ABC transporter ATP-binding protein n=1 Tax=unclassified Lysinibacillus TaxID=2636778 RepID=UPI000D52A3D2|nr:MULTISPECIES: energy-coupling factor ABC transporter ATP-binding protein [unclassified Lysinibacillus]AWE09057.1 energy-coupling factor ABC transporter ATP-binding protein [Lysinibacillus sp. 2017]TGN35881.1 energy-coupling factor ABC transporter ATP-binding protein [Lysinibacillus sp. S2017]